MKTKVCALSDGTLVAGLKALVVEERGLSAAMLEHLGEVEARRLYLPAACSSMAGYCVKVLRMAEQVARLAENSVARRMPVGCQPCVASREMLMHLPEELRGDARIISSGADLLAAIHE